MAADKLVRIRGSIKAETHSEMLAIAEHAGMTEIEFVRAAIEYAVAQNQVNTSENPRQRAEETRQMKLRRVWLVYNHWLYMPSKDRPRKGNGFVDGTAYQMMLPRAVQEELSCSYDQAVSLIKAVVYGGEGRIEKPQRDVEADAAHEAAAKLYLNAMEAGKGVDPLDRAKPKFAVKENEYANESAQWEEAQRLEEEMKENGDERDN